MFSPNWSNKESRIVTKSNKVMELKWWNIEKLNKNYPMNFKSLKKDKSNIIILEVYLMTNSIRSQIIDFGATNYVSYSLQQYKEIRRLKKGEFSFILRKRVQYQ